MEQISLTPEQFEELKVAYDKAVEDDKESFTFLNREWHTNYAKYVIEFLSQK